MGWWYNLLHPRQKVKEYRFEVMMNSDIQRMARRGYEVQSTSASQLIGRKGPGGSGRKFTVLYTRIDHPSQ